HEPVCEDRHAPEVAAREEIDEAEQGVLHAAEDPREGGAVPPGRGHVGPEPVGGQEPEGDEQPALELRDLGDVLEVLEDLDHAWITSVRPPTAWIFSTAAFEKAWACTVRTRPGWRLPSASTFTRCRTPALMVPASTGPSGVTVPPPGKHRARSLRLTTAYSVRNGFLKPRFGMRR